MAHEEGLRRLRFIVRGILMSGLTLIISGAVIKLLWMFLTDFESSGGTGLSICILFGIYLAVLGGILRVVLWIVEGFVQDANSPR
jgi:hypothetical protein